MTNMDNYYFKAIEKIPLLTKEEEKTLAAKAFSGDKNAQKKLVETNLRFVVKIARHYQGFMDLEDLIMEGNYGLMQAAEKYNPDNNTRFLTYAVWWVTASIQKAIRETSKGIRFPANKYDEMKKSKWNISSLDEIISGEDGEKTTLMAFIKDDKIEDPAEACWKNECMAKLGGLIKKLNSNEQLVITRRFGLDGNKPVSLSELSTLMGYSKEGVRQIEKKALMELRAWLEVPEKNNYLAA